MPFAAATPLEAVSVIEDGEAIWAHSMAATPVRLLEGLAVHARQRRNLTLLQLHLEGAGCMSDPELFGHLRHRAYFASQFNRELIAQGHADYVPIFLSEIPKLFRRDEQRVDTALIQVSPPDQHGLCSLGISVEATRAACEKAKRIIAHINPCMPRTHGDAFIPYDQLDVTYEEAIPLPEHLSDEPCELTRQIGQQVASLIGNGDCLQMGIGDIPNAVLDCLGNHQHLGVHTEMFSDGVIPLVESGVIDNSQKKIHPGKLVTGFVLGSQKLYNFVDDNPEVVFLDIEYVNSINTISRNKQVVSINSALQVDLSGQVCADSIGTRIYSGVGGQLDFILGANLSAEGRSILAFPSTAAGGKLSRIVPTLANGAGVVTPRASVHHIVTEYGVANLRGRSLRERAKALIDISHPNHREALSRAAFETWHVRVD